MMADLPTLFDDWRNMVMAVRAARLTADEYEAVQASSERLQQALEAAYPDGVRRRPTRAGKRANGRGG